MRVNGKIRAREVRVIDGGQKNLGGMPLSEGINLARSQGVDLVEVNPNAVPPVCRLVDFGKFRYEPCRKASLVFMIGMPWKDRKLTKSSSPETMASACAATAHSRT